MFGRGGPDRLRRRALQHRRCPLLSPRCSSPRCSSSQLSTDLPPNRCPLPHLVCGRGRRANSEVPGLNAALNAQRPTYLCARRHAQRRACLRGRTRSSRSTPARSSRPGIGRLTAAIPAENPYYSCKLTRVRIAGVRRNSASAGPPAFPFVAPRNHTMALVRARSSGATLLRWGGTRSHAARARHASALTRHDSCTARQLHGTTAAQAHTFSTAAHTGCCAGAGHSRGVLFSSDVSARGVDYPDVTHVLQFGMPASREQVSGPTALRP